ncbi:MipA/OmpV family protein [Neoroseomonas lacus]|uniref:MltA-interacting MipA family protein n=1 Tax=Neoroseomonas lacus TaxID=287609 RepID=A0A917L2D2_9PROT|nr:MipA/OmpV family protein [Neoroseomonas lacus]GGJ41317.1 MltA-interacting MipA family protein [Neoroseomonas lacus]
MTPDARRLRQTRPTLVLLAVTGIATVLPPAARAQQAPIQVEPSAVRQGADLEQSQWQVRLGAGVAFGPAYPGSSTIRALPLPVVEIAYRPELPFLDSVFLNGRDGFGAVVFRQGPISIGGSIGFAPGRDQDVAARLHGMGDIEAAARASAFVRADFGPFGLSLQSFTAVGDQQGTTVVLGASLGQPIAPGLMMMGKVEATWADQDNMQEWFGVTAQQASRSRFAAYNAGAGFRSVSANLTAIYKITDTWSVSVSGGVSQLLGDAADSPITQRATQPFGLLGFTYRF